MNVNEIYCDDCIHFMSGIEDNSFNFTLTDIPYGAVTREGNGLRSLNKGEADIETFDLQAFLPEIHRVTKGTVIIFCGKEQISPIWEFFNDKQGTLRQIIWEKTNPSPMNGQYVYLSGIENAVWFKKRGAVFNTHCKNTVFRYPVGRSKLHPTEKNHELLRELIRDNSDEGDLIFDPCCGSGAHCLVAKEEKRDYVGVELHEKYYRIAKERLQNEI